jgi:hypothetical protein
MALIKKYKQITEHKKETQYTPEMDVPALCPKCGNESMYSVSSERYGGWKTKCFSSQCLKVYNIGMIRGDIYPFTKREYKQPGDLHVSYPKADGYSAELREAIKNHLIGWGFENITFKEPGENSNDYHTIIRGNHKAPSVNIWYKHSPKTDRVLCFDNKYGVVHLTKGYHDTDEKDYWRQWNNIESEINGYLKRSGCNPSYIGLMDRLFALPNREQLRDAATAGLLQSRKNERLSQIRSHMSKINEYRRKIVRENDEITSQKAKYEQDFGEVAPEQTVSY